MSTYAPRIHKKGCRGGQYYFANGKRHHNYARKTRQEKDLALFKMNWDLLLQLEDGTREFLQNVRASCPDTGESRFWIMCYEMGLKR